VTVVKSLAISVLASLVGTLLLRRLVASTLQEGTDQAPEEKRRRRPGSVGVIVIVPVLVGNSNNKLGLIREDSSFPLFGWRRRR
jgi:hypothetical protein